MDGCEFVVLILLRFVFQHLQFSLSLRLLGTPLGDSRSLFPRSLRSLVLGTMLDDFSVDKRGLHRRVSGGLKRLNKRWVFTPTAIFTPVPTATSTSSDSGEYMRYFASAPSSEWGVWNESIVIFEGNIPLASVFPR